MNYLVIKNGFVVRESAIIIEDILVGGSKVLQIGPNLQRPTSGTPVIDASGKYVLPGAVDMNRHFLFVGETDKAEDELRKLNQAEIFNGTTTMIDAVDDFYDKNYVYNIYKAKQKAHYNLIDYGFHLSFTELKKSAANAFNYSYIHEGISTLLLNMSIWKKVNLNVLESIVCSAAKYNLLIICDMVILEVDESNRGETEISKSTDLSYHFKALSVLLDLGLKHKCPLLFLNVKFKEELQIIQQGIAKGGDFMVSICMPFSINMYDRTIPANPERLSEIASAYGLKPISEEEVWLLVKQKRFLINPPSYNLTIDQDSEDDLVYNRPDKFFYLRNYLSMLFTVGVSGGRINILDMVDIVSARPAKIMGLWPQKGVLQAGADADFVIWNPTFDRNLYCSMSNAEHDSSKKHKLKGRPDFVFAKGRMMYNGESFYPKHADGSFVYRSAPVL